MTIELKSIEFKKLYNVRLTWAEPQLKLAQRNFNKSPTALNWNLCLRAMLVHQQLAHACRSHSVDRQSLVAALECHSFGQWQDIICRATLGVDCNEALQDATIVAV